VALKKKCAEPMKWLEASLLWQEFLADHFFVKKWLREKKTLHVFSGKILLVCLSQKNQIAYASLIKERRFHKCPRHWAIRGPNSLDFSRFVPQGSQLQQFFPELILEPKEERNVFYKSNVFFLFFFSCFFLFLFIFLFLFLCLFLVSCLVLFLFPFLFLFLFLSFSLLFSCPFSVSFSYYTFIKEKTLEVEKVTQSTC